MAVVMTMVVTRNVSPNVCLSHFRSGVYSFACCWPYSWNLCLAVSKAGSMCWVLSLLSSELLCKAKMTCTHRDLSYVSNSCQAGSMQPGPLLAFWVYLLFLHVQSSTYFPIPICLWWMLVAASSTLHHAWQHVASSCLGVCTEAYYDLHSLPLGSWSADTWCWWRHLDANLGKLPTNRQSLCQRTKPGRSSLWRVELIQHARGWCPRTTAEQGNSSQRPMRGQPWAFFNFVWISQVSLTSYTWTSSMLPPAWHVNVLSPWPLNETSLQ